MRWLWDKIGWFGRLKARFWAWAIMGMGLTFGGESMLNALTYDEIQGRVTGVVRMCKIKCEKIRYIPRGVSTDPAPCPDVAATIARAGADKCRPEQVDHYAIRFADTDGKPASAMIPKHKFDDPRSVGDAIPVLRDPQARAAIVPPPSSFDFMAFAVGLILFGWLVLRPVLRLWFARRTKPPARPARPAGPMTTQDVPRTVVDSPARQPIVKQRTPRRGRYIVNGPIRTRKR